MRIGSSETCDLPSEPPALAGRSMGDSNLTNGTSAGPADSGRQNLDLNKGLLADEPGQRVIITSIPRPQLRHLGDGEATDTPYCPPPNNGS